jgi:hypothetical protein
MTFTIDRIGRELWLVLHDKAGDEGERIARFVDAAAAIRFVQAQNHGLLMARAMEAMGI